LLNSWKNVTKLAVWSYVKVYMLGNKTHYIVQPSLDIYITLMSWYIMFDLVMALISMFVQYRWNWLLLCPALQRSTSIIVSELVLCSLCGTCYSHIDLHMTVMTLTNGHRVSRNANLYEKQLITNSTTIYNLTVLHVSSGCHSLSPSCCSSLY